VYSRTHSPPPPGRACSSALDRLWKVASIMEHSHKNAPRAPSRAAYPCGVGPSVLLFERKDGTRKPPTVRQPDRCRPRTRQVRGRRQSRWLLTWPAALLCVGSSASERTRTRCKCRYWPYKNCRTAKIDPF
jgi:hypothetical protein